MATGDARQNGGLPTIAVSRAMLAMAPARKKVDVILSASDPRAFVRQLPAEDVYFAIKEIGVTDAVEIIALASPSQFRAFVDLDAWEEDAPDPLQVLKWLELAAQGARFNAQFRAKRAYLDAEVMLIVLKSQTIVHSLEENDDPILTSSNIITTAERKYIIEIIDEGEAGMTTRKLIEDYIDENPFQATRLFESVRWESKAELEETARRWRIGRMRDMGFPELEEAIRIWTPAPTTWKPQTTPVIPGPVSGVPALLLVASRQPLFLDRVVEKLPDDTRPYFNEGLIYLLNCAIVADGIDIKELDFARETLAATRDMLSLGLELTSSGSEDAALAILGSTSAVELFRYAVGRITLLSRAAGTAVKPLSFGGSGGTALDPPDSEIISGLRRKRPRVYAPPEPGGKPKPGGDWRAFRDEKDLQSVDAAIQRTKAAGAALTALGVDTAAANRLAELSGRATTALSVGQILLTVAVQTLKGAPTPLTPIPATEVGALCQLFEGGRLTSAAREGLKQWSDDLRSRIDAALQAPFDEILQRSMARLEDELGAPCAAGGIEAQFVECLLVAGAEAPAEVLNDPDIAPETP